MPDPLRGFYEQTGMLSPYYLPTLPQLRVLEHLMRPGPPEPRLFIGLRDGVETSGVSNAYDAIGFSTSKIYLDKFFHNNWIELDDEWTRRASRGIKAYRITDAGIDAISQYYARERYILEHVALAKSILNHCRKATKSKQRKLAVKAEKHK